MRKARQFSSSFVSGELSEAVDAYEDLARYRSGLSVHDNRFVAKEGGSIKRSGTLKLARAKSDSAAAPARIESFKAGNGVEYTLEFGVNVIRVHDENGPVLSGGLPYEIVTTYAAADLPLLNFWRDADVMWIGRGGTKKIGRLAHSGPTSWSLTDQAFSEGPFLPENADRNFTISYNAVTGAVTLTASAPLFDASHVGSLWRIRHPSGALPHNQWEADTNYAAAARVRNDGKVYQANSVSALWSGFGAPTHDYGTASDGRLDWIYLHDGAGVVEITGFTSDMVVTGQVRRTLPYAPSQVTSFWSEGAFSGRRGYPEIGHIVQERHLLGGTPSEISMLNFSELGSAAGFRERSGLGVILATNAFRRALTNENASYVRWIAGRSLLLVGTEDEEYVVTGVTDGEGISALSARARSISNFGAARANIVTIGSATLFIQKGRREIREMVAEEVGEGYKPAALAELAQHLTAQGLVGLAVVDGPPTLVFAWDRAGQLRCMTYDRAQKLVAWQRVTLGGAYQGRPPFVESCAPFRRADGQQVLRLAVLRTINGVTRRFIEEMQPRFDKLTMRPDDAIFLDCCGIYDGWNADAARSLTLTGADWTAGQSVTATANFALFGGGAGQAAAGRELLLGRWSRPASDIDVWPPVRVRVTGVSSGTVATVELLSDVPAALRGVSTVDFALTVSTVTGIDWLEGETVGLACDGADGGTAIVSGNQVSVPDQPAGRVVVGKKFKAVLDMLSAAPGNPGETRGGLNRIVRATISLDASAGGTYCQAGSKVYPIPTRRAGDPLSVAAPLFSGDINLTVASSSVLNPHLRIEHDEPLPHYIKAITTILEVAVDV